MWTIDLESKLRCDYDREQTAEGCHPSDSCETVIIKKLPAVITHPGTYTLCKDKIWRKEGPAIVILSDNVTLNFNHAHLALHHPGGVGVLAVGVTGLTISANIRGGPKVRRSTTGILIVESAAIRVLDSILTDLEIGVGFAVSRDILYTQNVFQNVDIGVGIFDVSAARGVENYFWNAVLTREGIHAALVAERYDTLDFNANFLHNALALTRQGNVFQAIQNQSSLDTSPLDLLPAGGPSGKDSNKDGSKDSNKDGSKDSNKDGSKDSNKDGSKDSNKDGGDSKKDIPRRVAAFHIGDIGDLRVNNVVVRDNLVNFFGLTPHTYGILFVNGNGATIAGNSLTGSDHRLEILGDAFIQLGGEEGYPGAVAAIINASVQGNKISGQFKHGIVTGSNATTVVTGSVITGNQVSFTGIGILNQSLSVFAQVRDNTVTLGEQGIVANPASQGLVIEKNHIAGNAVGIQLNWDGVTVLRNVVTGNRRSIEDNGTNFVIENINLDNGGNGALDKFKKEFLQFEVEKLKCQIIARFQGKLAERPADDNDDSSSSSEDEDEVLIFAPKKVATKPLRPKRGYK